MKTVSIDCSDCNSRLMNLFLKGHTDHTSKIKATCPFCKGCSFTKEIDEEFSFGPVPPEISNRATYIDDVLYENGVHLFKIGACK